MDLSNISASGAASQEEKKKKLYDSQVATLAVFLEHGAITRAQYDKSLHDLSVKMGYAKD